MVQEANTLTTRNRQKCTFIPMRMRMRAIRLAPFLASSSLVAPMHVIFPEFQMEAVIFGLRNFMETQARSRLYSVLQASNATLRRFK